MNDGQLVVAYHGCDITTRDDLVAGRTRPISSQNKYDWLGPGFYLFEGDPDRAEAFAHAAVDAPERRFTAKPIATAAVVGCVFSIQRCLDMTTRLGLLEFEAARPKFEAGYLASSKDPLPVNTPPNGDDVHAPLQQYDNAVFAFIHSSREAARGPIYYQAVRGAFRQGPELAPNSGFHRDSHIQIALRDPGCVLAWFLPGDAKLLSELDYAAADVALDRAKTAYTKNKPRKRVYA